MEFLFGCLAVLTIVISLVVSIDHQKRDDICIIHWLLGFCAALLFALSLALGIWW